VVVSLLVFLLIS